MGGGLVRGEDSLSEWRRLAESQAACCRRRRPTPRSFHPSRPHRAAARSLSLCSPSCWRRGPSLCPSQSTSTRRRRVASGATAAPMSSHLSNSPPLPPCARPSPGSRRRLWRCCSERRRRRARRSRTPRSISTCTATMRARCPSSRARSSCGARYCLRRWRRRALRRMCVSTCRRWAREGPSGCTSSARPTMRAAPTGWPRWHRRSLHSSVYTAVALACHACL